MGLFNFLFGSSISVSIGEPSVNIDGSPMCGSFDINGNIYEVTTTNDSINDGACFDDSSCGGFDDW